MKKLKNPLVLFTILLIVLFGLIWASNYFNRVEVVPEVEKEEIKEVEIFEIGTPLKIRQLGRVKKVGLVTIYAQTSGIVRNVNYNEGDVVSSNNPIVSLSTTYSGQSVTSLQRKQAALNYQNTLDTYDRQLELINKNEEIAKESEDNAEEMRGIAEDSADRLKDTINDNENALDNIENKIDELENNNSNGQNDEEIKALKAQKDQLKSSIRQSKSTLDTLLYNADDNSPQAEISELQQEVTLKSLELERINLELSKKISSLNLQIAKANESLLSPVSPIEGELQKVFVDKGDNVNPGDPIAVVYSNNYPVELEVLTVKDISKRISTFKNARIILDENYFVSPTYISKEPTNGALYSIKFNLEVEEFEYANLNDGQYVDVEFELASLEGTKIMVPISSVTLSSDKSFVFVINNDEAISKKIKLGKVVGAMVEVEEGLDLNDKVILTKQVVNNDKVTIKE